jgi:RNA polymerase sigma-70 factor (ECF subfamily)
MESMGCIEDRFLVREAKSGNQAAFEQLVHAYDQAVLRLAFQVTGSQSDAQDIYQGVFLKIYKELGGFRFKCSFSTWIFRIATSACLNHLRKNRNHGENNTLEVNVEGNECDLVNQVWDGRLGNSPEQQLLRQALSAQIACALEKLTPRERMVFELKHSHGLKLRTVSEILNTSEGSVRASLFRAVQKLRFQLVRLRKGTNTSVKQPCDTKVNQPAILQKQEGLMACRPR